MDATRIIVVRGTWRWNENQWMLDLGAPSASADEVVVELAWAWIIGVVLS